MLNKIHRLVPYAVVLSEFSHIFCCVLPTVFSLLSLLSGLGVIGLMPASMVALHDTLHQYEVPMIIMAAVILAIGWGLEFYAHKDCEDRGCCQSRKEKKKDWNPLILKIATFMLVFNLIVYFGFHRSHYIQEEIFGIESEELHQGHAHDHDH